MSQSSYKTLSSKDVSISAQASYSGIVKVKGSFEMDTKQKEAASSFNSQVETTTITVGAAPPSNGDALTWASTVKDSPVPTQYKLITIDELVHRQTHEPCQV